jgi:hypothetical protein
LEKLLKIKACFDFLILYMFLQLIHKPITCHELCFVKIKRVLIFSTAFVCSISHSNRNSARYGYKCTVCLFLWFCSPARAMASCDSAAQRGLWPSRSRGSFITHNDAPQSVGLLWTSDMLVAETST